MTYMMLRNWLNTLLQDQLNKQVIIECDDESHCSKGIFSSKEIFEVEDIELKNGHPVLIRREFIK